MFQNNENNERDIHVDRENVAEANNNTIPAPPAEAQQLDQRGALIDGVKLVVTFVVTFFSSLIPQNPAAIQN